MEGAHRRSIRRPEAEMGATRGFDGTRLRRDRELDAMRMRSGAIIGATAIKVEQPPQSDWTQRGIVKMTAPLQVGDAERDMIEHCALLRSDRDSSQDLVH